MGYGINLYKVKMNFNVCNLILHKFFHYDSTYMDTKKEKNMECQSMLN